MGPQISKFWGQKSTFSPLAANLSPTDQCFQHEKGVSLESRYKGTKIFTPSPQKIGFWAQKRPNLAQNWHFGPNIGIFGPFDLMPDQKNNVDKLSRWFSVMLVPKLLLTPIKIRIFGPKTAKFGPKSAFLVIFGQILPFLHILSNARPKNNVNKVPMWVFRYVGNKTFDFSSKKRIFCPKTTKFGPKLAFLVKFGPGHAGLFGALLVGRLVVVARGLYLARHLFTLFLESRIWQLFRYKAIHHPC